MSTNPSSNPTPEGCLPPEAHAWLAEHPEADPADLEEVWRLAEHALPPEAAFAPDPNRVEAMRARVYAVAVGASHPDHHAPVTFIRTVPRAWVVAASIVLLIAVGTWLFLDPVSLQAPVGERLTATLPDGSTVELNSGARLAYARPFTWGARSVRLTGEAFFDVASHPQKPFTIQTFNATVTVLGTRFNVRAWPDDPTPETTVVLEQGAVRLAPLDAPDQAVVLAPGQMSHVTGDDTRPAAPAAVSVEQALIWRQGGFFFSNHRVSAILAEAQRRFGIATEVPEALARQRMGLLLRQPETIDTVLDALCGFLECQYRATPNGYELLEPDAE